METGCTTAEEPDALREFRRDDLLRILRLKPSELHRWERAGLVETAELYSFDALRQLGKLQELSAGKLSVRSIRRSVDAMRQAVGGSQTTSILEAVAVGRSQRLRFRQHGALLDPMTRQMAFDFELARAAGCPRQVLRPSAPQGELLEMFQKAVRLEERPETLDEAKGLYLRILECAPRHATACINLGTIYYNERDYKAAEELYQRATEADPDYALAFFDLGNVLEEQQRLAEAIAAYERALLLLPQYADAHYNLALAYERTGEPRKALRHWTAYTQIDEDGPWSAHARSQRKKILAGERLAIVSRHGRTLKIAG